PVASSRKRRYSEPALARMKGARTAPFMISRRVRSLAAFKEIPPFYQRMKLSIRYPALQHPETAVGVDIAQPALSERLYDPADAVRDEIGLLHFVVLDIDYADTEGDFAVEIAKERQL